MARASPTGAMEAQRGLLVAVPEFRGSRVASPLADGQPATLRPLRVLFAGTETRSAEVRREKRHSPERKSPRRWLSLRTAGSKAPPLRVRGSTAAIPACLRRLVQLLRACGCENIRPEYAIELPATGIAPPPCGTPRYLPWTAGTRARACTGSASSRSRRCERALRRAARGSRAGFLRLLRLAWEQLRSRASHPATRHPRRQGLSGPSTARPGPSKHIRQASFRRCRCRSASRFIVVWR